jgi:hypothetical protein
MMKMNQRKQDVATRDKQVYVGLHHVPPKRFEREGTIALNYLCRHLPHGRQFYVQ